MSEHVVSEIADYLAGRLSPARMEEIRRHLAECEECAADFAWSREFRDEARAEGLDHLSADRILATAAAEGERVTESEHAHLGQCAACRAEVEWAKRQAPVEAALAELDAPETTGPESGSEADRARPDAPRRAMPRGTRLRWRWVWGTAAVAAAAVVVILLLPTSQPIPPATTPQPGVIQEAPVPSIAALARIEPLPVSITRGPSEPGSFEESRMQGLEAYVEGDYAAAVRHLRRGLELQPANHEVRLYLGSAELLRGDPATAEPLLDAAASRAAEPVRSEALWALASARMRLEDRSGALDALRRLKLVPGRHAAATDTLIAELDSLSKH
jgi:anti-sigma factor RsiW